MPIENLATPRCDETRQVFWRRTVAAQIHFLGLVCACAGLLVLLHFSGRSHQMFQVWACAIFGGTAILVFAVSSTYHFLSDGFGISQRLGQRFEDLDHFSIYLFIAGTYTPVLLNTLSQDQRVSMVTAVWVVAAAGIAYTNFKLRFPHWMQSRFYSTGLFLAMGWIALFRIGSILKNLSSFGVATLTLGAISYSLGALVYATRRPVLSKGFFGFHELWHLMVLLGFAFHYAMILNFYR